MQRVTSSIEMQNPFRTSPGDTLSGGCQLSQRAGIRHVSLWSAVGAIATLMIADVAHATETVRYIYDARGRLVRVERTGTVNNNVNTDYEYDRANNRLRMRVQGSPHPPPP